VYKPEWHRGKKVRLEQVLFGTDFYMTEREGPEQETVASAFASLGDLKLTITEINNLNYLRI